MLRFAVPFILLAFVFCGAPESHADEILLQNEFVTVYCDPSTLKLQLQSGERTAVLASAPQSGLGAVSKPKHTRTTANWEFIDRQTLVVLHLEGREVRVHFASQKVGFFTFPVIPHEPSTKGWILPLFEGVYVPAGDALWSAHLVERGEMNTTADFTMPFVGVDLGDRTLTCIVTNPFNNAVAFHASNELLTAEVTHEFTRNQQIKEYGVTFQFGGASPVEPGRIYREWLMQRREFVSMTEKIKQTPEAAKLLGAPHVYVWGEELITEGDVLKWKEFAGSLQRSEKSAIAAHPVERIWSQMGESARDAVTNIVQSEWADRYTKSLVLSELNALLLKRDFYDRDSWLNQELSDQTKELLKKGLSELTERELVKRNCALLYAAFPGVLTPPESWGGGISPKMMKQFSEAGLDRLWIGSSGWSGFVQRPETVETAKKLGFLVGPYDSYHSMHAPDQVDTWETAQLGAEIYKAGAIVNADGTKRKGFQKKGYLLSPIAARPYVEKRVDGLMEQFPANSWFMDCDGFGEFFDDYSEAHPATQLTDMQARCSRMAWIRDQFNVVIGTEGCSASVASTVLFAHGVMTPVIGWGDPDLKDKTSKYYLGAYYPAGEPSVFFKQVPIKEQFRYRYYEPRFRLPLFQTVFHDSVIATHHWSNPSLKFHEVADTVALLELLYNVPPLYHLTPTEFQKRKAQIMRHYNFFSPLHREIGLLPMTKFQWLSSDRSVQQTTFGDRVTMTANFGTVPYSDNGKQLPPRSIVADWSDGSNRIVYNPNAK